MISMRFPRPDQISNSFKTKIPTLMWFTLRQLLLSRLNIGVILLILIPILSAGLWVTDAFAEEEQKEPYGIENIYFNPMNENHYFRKDLQTVDVSIDRDELLYNYGNNNFQVELDGECNGDVDYMDITIMYYFQLDNFEQIQDSLDEIIKSYNQDTTVDPDVFKRTPDLFVPWDYTPEDAGNWSNCTNQISSFGFGRDVGGAQTFSIKLNRNNALPFEVQNEGIIFQFGIINFSVSERAGGIDWSDWGLDLEFGSLDYIVSPDANSMYVDQLNPALLNSFEQSRLYWPNQITIFIDAYETTDSGNNKIGQTYYTLLVKKDYQPGMQVNDAEEDKEEGHIVFITHFRPLYFLFINPIIILLFTSVAVSEDRENRTATYILSRPMSKISILMSKYFSANIAIWIMVIPSMFVTYFIMTGYNDGIGNSFEHGKIFFVMSGLVILASLIYSAFFTLYSSSFRMPLIFGIIYIFVFEMILANMNFSINRATFGYHLNTIAYHALKEYDAIDVYRPVSAFDSGMTIFVVVIIYIVLANLFFAEKDVH